VSRADSGCRRREDHLRHCAAAARPGRSECGDAPRVKRVGDALDSANGAGFGSYGKRRRVAFHVTTAKWPGRRSEAGETSWPRDHALRQEREVSSLQRPFCTVSRTAAAANRVRGRADRPTPCDQHSSRHCRKSSTRQYSESVVARRRPTTLRRRRAQGRSSESRQVLAPRSVGPPPRTSYS